MRRKIFAGSPFVNLSVLRGYRLRSFSYNDRIRPNPAARKARSN